MGLPTPTGRPVPVLAKHGYHGSVQDFSRRVEIADKAHVAAFGYKPSPGLMFDVARSQLKDEELPELFAAPRSKRHASSSKTVVDPGLESARTRDTVGSGTSFGRMAGTLLSVEREGPGDVATLKANLTRLASDPLGGKAYDDYVMDHVDEISELLSKNDREAVTLKALLETQMAGFVVGPPGYLGLPGLAFTQIGEALLFGLPVLAYTEGKAIGKDLHELNTKGIKTRWNEDGVELGDIGKRTRKANVDLAKGMAHGIAEDFRHPLENPGYLLLDILGAASLGAGAAARTAAAGSALRTQGVNRAGRRAAARALVTRPKPGTYELTVGDLAASVPLSPNAFARAFERGLLKMRQAELTRAHAGKEPIGLVSVVTKYAPESLRVPLSAEAKVRRQKEADFRVERAQAMGLKADLDHASRWTRRQARVMSVLFNRAPNLMVRALPEKSWLGTQKAIQVLATDDPNPVQVHRAFHQRMIKNADTIAPEFGVTPKAFVKRHQAQLGLLRLAEKTIENPPKNFQPLLDLTRKVVHEMERIKLDELGLDPVMAVGRVVNAAEVMRTGKPVAWVGRMEKQAHVNQLEGLLKALGSPERSAALSEYNPGAIQAAISRLRKEVEDMDAADPAAKQVADSFYLPFVPRSKSKRRPSSAGSPHLRDAGYGIGPAGNLAELNNAFTGDSIRMGDFRIDATTLVGEAYARTVRMASVRREYVDLLKASVETKLTDRHRPIRLEQDISPELRSRMAKIDSGEFTAADAASLRPEDIDALNRFLYPDEAGLGPIDNVRWVDESLLFGEDVYKTAMFDKAFRPFEIINEPARTATLFLRPAYALNALGNVGMLAIQQGWAAAPNMARAFNAAAVYGRSATNVADSIMGGGKTKSYYPDAGNTLTKVSRAPGGPWSAVVDEPFRRAALIYELRELNFKTPDEIVSALTDKTHRAKLNEAAQRAKKAVVEFDNMTWYEKAILRHVVFVYMWVSRSAVWGVRTIRDRPVKTDVLAQVGREAVDDIEEALGHIPEWIQRAGYFPVSWSKDGAVKLINGNSFNSFATLSDLIYPGMGLVTDIEYADLDDFFGPALEFFIHASTGRGVDGQKYEVGRLEGAARDLLVGTPQGAAIRKRNAEGDAPGAPADLSDPSFLVTREHKAQSDPVMPPKGFWAVYGNLIASGLAPKLLDSFAAEAKYWKAQPLEERHAHERDLHHQATKIQAHVLGKTGPHFAVTEALDLALDMDLAYKRFADKNGRTPTLKEKTLIDLRILKGAGKITDAEKKAFATKVAAADRDDLEDLRDEITDGHAAPLREWTSDVREVLSFTQPNLSEDIAVLRAAGLTVASPQARADQKTRHQYGRRYLAYLDEETDRRRALRGLTGDEIGVAYAELRAWEESQDKPVRVSGVLFPSPVRIKWARMSPKQREEHLIDRVTRPWSQLSSFEKEVLRGKPAQDTARSWADFLRNTRDVLAQLPEGEREGPRDWYDAYAETVEAHNPGFLEDYKFSREPLYRRLQAFKVIERSPNKEHWDIVLGVADQVWSQIEADPDSYSMETIYDVWNDYVDSTVQTWLADEPEFRRELSKYDPDLLYDLLRR